MNEEKLKDEKLDFGTYLETFEDPKGQEVSATCNFWVNEKTGLLQVTISVPNKFIITHNVRQLDIHEAVTLIKPIVNAMNRVKNTLQRSGMYITSDGELKNFEKTP